MGGRGKRSLSKLKPSRRQGGGQGGAAPGGGRPGDDEPGAGSRSLVPAAEGGAGLPAVSGRRCSLP